MKRFVSSIAVLALSLSLLSACSEKKPAETAPGSSESIVTESGEEGLVEPPDIKAEIDEEAWDAVFEDYKCSDEGKGDMHVQFLEDYEDTDTGDRYDYNFALYGEAAGKTYIEGDIIKFTKTSFEVYIRHMTMEKGDFEIKDNIVKFEYITGDDSIRIKGGSIDMNFVADDYDFDDSLMKDGDVNNDIIDWGDVDVYTGD
ncbi:MAG: hypothetical protein J5786_00930 [Clostridiales bacterium]|nr:hypothetical protein [Clostridiales bacterium]